MYRVATVRGKNLETFSRSWKSKGISFFSLKNLEKKEKSWKSQGIAKISKKVASLQASRNFIVHKLKVILEKECFLPKGSGKWLKVKEKSGNFERIF